MGLLKTTDAIATLVAERNSAVDIIVKAAEKLKKVNDKVVKAISDRKDNITQLETEINSLEAVNEQTTRQIAKFNELID